MFIGEGDALGWRYVGISFGKLADAEYFHALNQMLGGQNRGFGFPLAIPADLAGRADPPLPIDGRRRTLRLETFADDETPTLEPRRTRFARPRRACAEFFVGLAARITPD